MRITFRHSTERHSAYRQLLWHDAPAIALQDEGEALYFVADYHASHQLRDPIALRENSSRVALDFPPPAD